MTQLSKHFSLEELTFSETALRRGIDNIPSTDILMRLTNTAAAMEEVRYELAHPIYVSSGYRCLKLNRAIGSKDTSAHILGYAVDFTCPGFGNPKDVWEHIGSLNLKYDQLILEFGRWIHISFDLRFRQQQFKIG